LSYVVQQLHLPKSVALFGSLLDLAGGRPWWVAVYIIALSLITAAAIIIGPETHRGDIEHPDDTAPSASA
jgi:hypothetical protein